MEARIRRSLGMTVVSLAIGSAAFIDADDAKTTPAAAPASSSITIDAPLTQFVYRRRLSVDRVGVLSRTPREGQTVTAGEIVIRLRDDVPTAILAVAEDKARSEVDVRAAEKYAESERFEYKVMADGVAEDKASNRKPTWTNSEVQRARLRFESADLQTAVKKQERRTNELLRDQAIAELKTFHIVSPIDGVVTRVFHHEGEGVQQADAILEIVNTSRIRVEGRVPVALAAKIQPGTPVKVRFEGVGAAASAEASSEISGAIGFVDVSAEGVGQDRRVRLWAEIENPDGRYRDGLPAKMTILLDPVPMTAGAAADSKK